MQSDNTSKKPRKTAKEKTVASVETPKAEAVKTARATKSSPLKSSATTKKSGASPKHHHSIASEKIAKSPVKKIAPVAVAAGPVAEEKDYGHEDIARLAYSFWVARNYAHGSPDEDWIRAEKELVPSR